MSTTTTLIERAASAWRPIARQDPVWLSTLLLVGAVGFGLLGRWAAVGGHGLCDMMAVMTSWLVVPPVTAVAVGAWLLDPRLPARIRRLGAAVCLLLALLAGLAAPVADKEVERGQRRRLMALSVRVAPLIEAVAAYQRDHGAAPRDLRDVVPSYLPSLPGPAILGGVELYYSGAGRTLVYRLSQGELRLDFAGGGQVQARVVGVEGTPVAHFDALAWRRGHPVAQALAFARDFQGDAGLKGLVVMLGQPDTYDGLNAANWSLSLKMPAPRDGALRYVPVGGVGAPGQEVGRWCYVRD